MKKLAQLILLIGLISFSGCSVNNLPDQNAKPKIDENLPQVSLDSFKYISDITSIAFEWQRVKSPKIKGYYLYRAEVSKDATSFKRVAFIKGSYASHYLDADLKPDTQYIYAIATVAYNNQESRPTQTNPITTLPLPEPISFVEAISDLPKQIKIIWRPHPNSRINRYIIQRSTLKDPKWRDIATIKHRLNVEYINRNLPNGATYSYRIIAKTYDNIKTLPSVVVTATTKALPNPSLEIDATSNLPRKIRVTWKLRAKMDDLQYFKIYRSSSEHGYYELISKAKKDDNTFDDVINQDGKTEYYKITTVDKDNLESPKNTLSIIGKTLEKPAKPVITLAQIQDRKAILNWQPGDSRAVSYNIYKTVRKSFFDRATSKIKNTKELRFEDRDIIRGITYEYSIEAVDEFGLVSQKTKEATLIIPQVDPKENAPSTTK